MSVMFMLRVLKLVLLFSCYCMDDMLIVANHLYDVNELKIMLEKKFDMKDLDVPKKILVMEIHMDTSARKLWISKEIYVKNVLGKFDMNKLKVLSTPFVNHVKLTFDQYPKIEGKV